MFIINLLRDSRFYHFRPVMDSYIQNHFAGALAYKYNIYLIVFESKHKNLDLDTYKVTLDINPWNLKPAES